MSKPKLILEVTGNRAVAYWKDVSASGRHVIKTAFQYVTYTSVVD